MERRVGQVTVLSVPVSLVAGIRYLLFLALAVFLLKAAIIEAFFVPSRSMLPTIRSSDYILVPKFAYGLHLPWMKEAVIDWKLPELGDIVVFTRPDNPSTKEDESEQNMVKRVIGLPNSVVEIAGTTVFIDGVKLFEPYAVWSPIHHERGHFGPVKVPANHVLLLGDNRDASQDSRVWNEPFVHVKRIKGRAVMVYWSGSNSNRAGKML